MKKILVILGIAIVALATVAASAFLLSALGLQKINDGFEQNGVRVVKDDFVSFGVVDVGDGGVALIDAGADAAGQAVFAELARRNLGGDAVKAIFLTHGHRDHIAAVPLFPKAEVMARAPAAAVVEGRVGTKGPLTRFVPVRPTGIKVTRILQDGEIVMVGKTAFQAFAVPGHTAGSAAYLVNGVLFLGDAANIDKDGRLIGATWAFSENISQDWASLARLRQTLEKENVDIEVIVAAHSGVLVRGLRPLADFADRP